MRAALALSACGLSVLAGCGYQLAARPALPAGVERIEVLTFENATAEVELGTLMATHLAQRAESEDRLAGRGGGQALLRGRIDRASARPDAFPGNVSGAGLYSTRLDVRLRLTAADGRTLREVRVSGEERYLAGRGPEETEVNRRRAVERLAARLADEGWQRLTAPGPGAG